MANGLAASGSIRTICLPIGEPEYRQIADNSEEFRRLVDHCYQQMPELFPEGFEKGYELKDRRESRKTGLTIRRIELRDGTAYSVRPSFLMPYLSGRTDDVEAPLFLRKFGVPYWALAHVFGRDAMYWYRMETGLGRNSIVEPPSAGRRCPNTCWPTSIIKPGTRRRTTSPPPSARGLFLVSRWPKRRVRTI